jgi:CHASE2 domain-containing sensor protein
VVTRERKSVSGRTVIAVVAALVAVGAGAAAEFARLLPGLEQDSVNQRFERRGAVSAPGLLVVAIDDKTFDDLGESWPFPRSRHAQAIDRLRRDGAAAVVYDVQFTEQTTPREDNALIAAVGRARNVVLATAETDEHGNSNVLGGDEQLARLGARAGASNLPPGPGGVLQRFDASAGGLETLAMAAAHRIGRAPAIDAFDPGGAWIDFRGPPGTIDTVSFSDLLKGRVDPALVRGRIVVVGATAATLQDVHPTPTASGELMSGPEIEANAIYTATHGLPLRDAPRWIDLLAILALGMLPALASLRLRALLAALLAPGVAIAWLVVAQLAFDRGHVLSVAAPLFAVALGTVATIAAGYLAERKRRHSFAVRNEALEEAVHVRRGELRETQLEIIHRLAAATESRDEETGLHLERIGLLCERVGLVLGLTAAEAETLRHASLLHDVGDPDQARQADRGGVGRHAPPRRGRRAHPLGLDGADHAHGRGDRPHPPRALGRRRLPGRPVRRADPARGAHLRGVRRLRCAALAAPLQGALAGPGCARRAAPRTRQALRPRSGRRLHDAGRRPRSAALRRPARARNLRLAR